MQAILYAGCRLCFVMSILKLRILHCTSVVFGVILLFTPIIWMEIGPLGKAYYGPTVPDIYIYGGAITGKDLNWEPILVAMIFQLVMILFGILLSVICFFTAAHSRAWTILLTSIQTILLVLFPMWMMMYSGHVINNSDGAAADLTVHFGAGSWIYFVLLGLNIAVYAVLIKAKRTSRRENTAEN